MSRTLLCVFLSIAFYIFATTSGLAAAMHDYNTDVKYKKGEKIAFRDFTISLVDVVHKTFDVRGTTRSSTTEMFDIVLPNGTTIRRELTNGFPGGVSNGFQFRAKRDVFFSVNVNQGVLTARSVDEVFEVNKAGESVRYRLMELGKSSDVEGGVVYVFASFDMQIVDIRPEKKVKQLTAKEIEDWYKTSHKAIEDVPDLNAAAKQMSLKALADSKKQLERNPTTEVLLHYFTFEFKSTDASAKTTTAVLDAHAEQRTKVTIGDDSYEIHSSPPADHAQAARMTVKIVAR